MLQHPSITRTMQLGYPIMANSEEHVGVDYFGDEILANDQIVVDEEKNEIILKENLEAYLEEVYGFSFKSAE